MRDLEDKGHTEVRDLEDKGHAVHYSYVMTDDFFDFYDSETHLENTFGIKFLSLLLKKIVKVTL